MKILLMVLTSALFLSACEFQQDPLTGAPGPVQAGEPPEANKPLPEKAVPKEALQIDAPTLVNGRVGSAVEFKVLGRAMDPSIAYEVSIDNLTDFPGATYDAGTGEFKWVPARAQVGSIPSMEMQVRVTLTSIPSAKYPTISQEKKTIVMVIANVYTKPIINQITGTANMVAGQSYKFDLELEDVDAFMASDISLAPVDCSTYYTKSITHFAQVNKITAGTTAGKYVAEIIINLTNADTLPSGNYCIAMMAVSKHGVSSDVYKKEFGIEGKVRATRATLEAISIFTGQTAQFTFSVYDPSGNGEVTMFSEGDLATQLPGSSMKCLQNAKMKSQIDCDVFVVTAGAAVKTYSINMIADNKGPRSTQKVSTSHTLRISVKGLTNENN